MALCCSVYTFKSICQVLLKTLLKFLLEKKMGDEYIGVHYSVLPSFHFLELQRINLKDPKEKGHTLNR